MAARRSNRVRESTVGVFSTEWWHSRYNAKTGQHEQEGKEKHRQYKVRLCIGAKDYEDQWYARQGLKQPIFGEHMTDAEIASADMTMENATTAARDEQASVLDHLGYGGPVSGGEARALKNLFEELGFSDLVKKGWARVATEVTRQPSRWQLRQAQRAYYQTITGNPNPPAFVPPAGTRVKVDALRTCFLFKSPIEGIHFSKFIKLARMYKDDSGKLKDAVRALIANPDAHKEIESIDAIELLAGLGGDL